MVEADDDPGQWQDLDAGRRQLDGQRQAVEAMATARRPARHSRIEAERRPRKPSPAGRTGRQPPSGRRRRRFRRARGKLERREGIFVLARNVERRPARGQDPQRGSSREQARQIGRGVRDVLEVVQHHEHPTRLEMAPDRLEERTVCRGQHAERLRQAREHQARIGNRSEPDEPHPVREATQDAFRELAGESGLAGARRARHRHEPSLGQEAADLAQLGFAADEARQRHGQVVGNQVPCVRQAMHDPNVGRGGADGAHHVAIGRVEPGDGAQRRSEADLARWCRNGDCGHAFEVVAIVRRIGEVHPDADLHAGEVCRQARDLGGEREGCDDRLGPACEPEGGVTARAIDLVAAGGVQQVPHVPDPLIVTAGRPAGWATRSAAGPTRTATTAADPSRFCVIAPPDCGGIDYR